MFPSSFAVLSLHPDRIVSTSPRPLSSLSAAFNMFGRLSCISQRYWFGVWRDWKSNRKRGLEGMEEGGLGHSLYPFFV